MKNMKRFASNLLIISMIIMFSVSCDNTKIIDNKIDDETNDITINDTNILVGGEFDYENNYTSFTAEEDDFTYVHDDGNIISYCIDDNGLFYYFSNEYETDAPYNESKLFTMDLNGNLINETNLGIDYFHKMVVEDNILYYSPVFIKEVKICSVDLSTGEKSVVCVLDDFLEIKNIIVTNNTLYFIGIEKKATGRDYNLFNYSDNFYYYGEIIGSIDLKTGEMKDVFTELPINFTETPNGNLMIYAYDENGGYYFQEYNVKSGSFSNKLYKTYDSLRDNVTDFAITKNNEIIFRNINILKLSNLNKNEAITEIADNVDLFSNVVLYKSGYLFYKTKDGVKRIFLDTVFKSNVVLNMGYTNKGMDFPSNCGFLVNNNEIGTDELAMSILAGNTDIDLYLINSLHNYTDNVRNKNAYYKLNNVPYVSEYIEALFPYVKDAAVNKNGDIWMIPVKLNMYGVEYNEKVWERYGLDIKSINTLQELIDIMYYFDENNADETYWVNANDLILKYFYQLIEINNGFNKDDFKKMAEYSYDKLNFIKNPIKEFLYGVLINKSSKTDFDSYTGGLYNGFIDNGKFLYGGFYGTDSFILDKILTVPDFDDFEIAKNDPERTFFTNRNYSHLRYISPPTIKGTNKNDITCEFLYINPNSKNLDVVLEYISEFCKQSITKRNTFILKDKATYDDRVYINDLYEMYNGNNFIRFGWDSEIFIEDFIKYLGDEITLDEYLNTIEYKINAYMNE